MPKPALKVLSFPIKTEPTTLQNYARPILTVAKFPPLITKSNKYRSTMMRHGGITCQHPSQPYRGDGTCQRTAAVSA